MSVAVVIPARLASSRFHAKPLAPISGQPLVRHVVERVQDAGVDRVVLATDSAEIAAAVDGTRCEVFMSRVEHPSGTDRIAEAAGALDTDWIINVQGDQLVPGPETIDGIVAAIHPDTSVATLYTDLGPDERADDVNVVKVVIGADRRVVYMSRYPVPFDRARKRDDLAAGEAEDAPRQPAPAPRHFRQLGVYVFARQRLIDFAALPPSDLEAREGIELLRALHHGWRVDGIYSRAEFADVDVPEDVPAAEAFVSQHPIGAPARGGRL